MGKMKTHKPIYYEKIIEIIDLTLDSHSKEYTW